MDDYVWPFSTVQSRQSKTRRAPAVPTLSPSLLSSHMCVPPFHTPTPPAVTKRQRVPDSDKRLRSSLSLNANGCQHETEAVKGRELLPEKELTDPHHFSRNH